MEEKKSNAPGGLRVIELLDAIVNFEKLSDRENPQISIHLTLLSGLVAIPAIRSKFSIGKVEVNFYCTVFENEEAASNRGEIPF